MFTARRNEDVFENLITKHLIDDKWKFKNYWSTGGKPVAALDCM